MVSGKKGLRGWRGTQCGDVPWHASGPTPIIHRPFARVCSVYRSSVLAPANTSSENRCKSRRCCGRRRTCVPWRSVAVLFFPLRFASTSSLIVSSFLVVLFHAPCPTVLCSVAAMTVPAPPCLNHQTHAPPPTPLVQNVMVRVGGGWETLPRFLETLVRTDPRLIADKEKYTSELCLWRLPRLPFFLRTGSPPLSPAWPSLALLADTPLPLPALHRNVEGAGERAPAVQGGRR